MMAAKKVVLVGYIPVLHRGYLRWFDAYPEAKELYVFGSDILKLQDYLRKDLRMLPPATVVKVIKGLERFTVVRTISKRQLGLLDSADTLVVMPDEDISHEVAKNLKLAKIEYYPVFLRWDRRAINDVNKTAADVTVTRKAFDKQMIQAANQQAQKSSDIWRRVGAALVSKNGTLLSMAANQGQPTDITPWMDGDPRNAAKRGVAIELSSFIHAEAKLIAEAAKKGINLIGASMYVSTFPCPVCAKLIANSGIQSLYFQDGYAVLDGRHVLEANDVKIIQVVDEKSADDLADPRGRVEYKD